MHFWEPKPSQHIFECQFFSKLCLLIPRLCDHLQAPPKRRSSYTAPFPDNMFALGVRLDKTVSDGLIDDPGREDYPVCVISSPRVAHVSGRLSMAS